MANEPQTQSTPQPQLISIRSTTGLEFSGFLEVGSEICTMSGLSFKTYDLERVAGAIYHLCEAARANKMLTEARTGTVSAK